jgi:PAS domain S-box-containing protein
LQNDLRLLVDKLPGLVWTTLPNGQVDFLNQPWCDYTGMTLERACGSGWLEAICPDDLPRMAAYWQSILKLGSPGEIEARLRSIDGAFRWFLFRANPVRNASGDIVKWIGTNTDIEDRVRAENSVRASERHFREIVDSIPALIAVMNSAGEVEVVNRQCLEYFDKTLDELKVWMAVGGTVHADDLPAVTLAWMRSIETGEPYDIEHRIRRNDGSYRWFHVRGLPLRDGEGRIVRWHVLQVDIDEQKSAEAMLAAKNRLLEMVAAGESLQDVLMELCCVVEAATDTQCSVVLVDPTRLRLEHGVAPTLPPTFLSAINGRPVNAESGPCAMAAFLNHQVVSTDIAADLRWADWNWCPLALSHGLRACWSTPIRSKNGSALGAFALYYKEPRTPTAFDQRLIEQFTDLASIAIERSQNDAALKRSEDLLAAVQRLSSTGAFSWLVATNTITWSKEVYRIFEIDVGVPVTIDLIATRLHPDDAVEFYEMLERRRSGGDFEYEHRLLMPDQSTKYVHVVAHATLNRDGDLEYIAALQDITPRRLSESALELARSELARVARVAAASALTASIAHEVNQPLSGIITNAGTSLRMLTDDPPNVDDAIEAVRRTTRDANRAAQVVARVRALYRKSETTSDWVDLNEAIREVVALTASEIQRARVNVDMELLEDLPLARGDRVQLQQVMLNLLLNGIEAMGGVSHRARHLIIRTDCEGDDRVRLSVRDSGSGLDPDNLTQPFEAFYTTKSGGMGIGLSVSRSIVQSHDGRLWAMPNDGPGATFAFSIPREFDRGSVSA